MWMDHFRLIHVTPFGVGCHIGACVGCHIGAYVDVRMVRTHHGTMQRLNRAGCFMLKPWDCFRGMLFALHPEPCHVINNTVGMFLLATAQLARATT
jgi:hypothetical protein